MAQLGQGDSEKQTLNLSVGRGVQKHVEKMYCYSGNLDCNPLESVIIK